MTAPVGYAVKTETVHACGADLEMRSLLDLQQFCDPDGVAAREGVSEELWAVFGVVWPSARVLAHQMATLTLGGQRILEVGCGLALASIVLHRRAGDVTATDRHPLVPEFLSHNLKLNALTEMPYHAANWAKPDPTLGRFDLIIGSEVLYERAHPGLLSSFINAHAEADGHVLLVDPGRGERSNFNHEMADLGFAHQWTAVTAAPGLDTAYKGRLLRYAR